MLEIGKIEKQWAEDAQSAVDAVKKAEKELLPVESSADELLYKTNLGAFEVNIRYRFTDNRLTFARYEFTDLYRDTSVYNDIYNTLQSQLSRKYGPAADSTLNCKDDFYRLHPNRWGTGIVVGKLTRESSWNLPKSKLRHSIASLPGGRVAHWVEYMPATEISQTAATELLGSL